MVSEEAVNAAAEALNGFSWLGHFVVREGTAGAPVPLEIFIREDMAPVIARAALDAAMPHIRQELAAEIESEVERLVRSMGPGDADQGYFDAARIVRGETDE